MAAESDFVSSPSLESSVTPSRPVDALSFRTTFDFRNFVESQMLIEDTKENNDIIRQSAQIVGQESDGSMLLVWDGPRKDSADRKVVTHFGVYHSSSPSYRTLYTHDSRIEVSGATIDSYRTLLAFTICEQLPNGINYDTFVSEISPCNRVFSLNIPSSDIRKLQFIQPPPSSKKNTQKSNLLVIIPEHWICMYRFQLEPIHKGWAVVSQPKQDVIVQSASWYQWEPKFQWLCYGRFGATPTQTKRAGKSNVSDSSVIVHVISFAGGEQNVLVTVALPIPFKHAHYTELSTYYPSPLAFTLPVFELNMKMLHNHEGIWCVCLQHSDGRQHQRDGTAEPKLEYSVYLLHKGHVIDGEVTLSESTETGHHINFLLLGSFVVAYVPQVMLHILNTSVHTDPGNHIVLKGDHAPSLASHAHSSGHASFSLAKGVGRKRPLSAAVADRASSDMASSVFDVDNQIFYSCRLEPEGLFNVFKETCDGDLRLSLLHVVIVGLQQYAMGVRMMEYICQSPLTLDTYRLFQEFIVALSFSTVLSDCPAYLSRHLPLTTALSYQGSIYKNEDGTKYAILRCTELPNFVKQLLVQSDQRFVTPSPDQLFNYSRASTDSLGHLCFHSVLSQPQLYKRLSLEELAVQVRAMAAFNPPSMGAVSSSNGKLSTTTKRDKLVSSDSKGALGRSGTFVDKLKVFINSPKLGHHGSHGQGVACLPFLLPDEDLESALKIRLHLLRDRMYQVISTMLGLRAKQCTTAMIAKCEAYWMELQSSSRILLQVIWESLKFTNQNHPLQSSIHRQPSIEEGVLFELLESFYTANIELGLPSPSGCATLFVCMGYMCLEPSVFVQYLRHDVFLPTRRFLQLLFTNSENVSEDFLFEVVANLSYESQEIAFDLWKHPLLQRLMARDPGSSNGAIGTNSQR